MHGYSMKRSANFLTCTGLRPQIRISLIFSSREMAATCASACRPVPITPSTISFFATEVFCCNSTCCPGPHVGEACCIDDGNRLAGCKIENDGEGHDGRETGFADYWDEH